MDSHKKSNRGLLLLIVMLGACAAPMETISGTPTPLVTTPTSAPQPADMERSRSMRLQDSGVAGTFTAKDNGDGSTLLSIQLHQASDLNPWGIYNTGDCVNGVPENTRPVFSLPDIESGAKEETVETNVYQSTPGDLIVIVYGIKPDGSQQMIACARLGLPIAGTNASALTATPDCPSFSSHPAVGVRHVARI